MKTFGADRELQEKYRNHHVDDECTGVWNYVEEEMPYRIDEGIIVVIRNAPMVKCSVCGAMYFKDGFEESFLKHLAQKMVLSTRNLHKNEIRFLRTYIGYTQEKLAQVLGVSKPVISKYESATNKDERAMDDGMLVRFKLVVAGEMGLVIKPESKFWKVDHLTPAKSQVINAKDIQQVG
jgi:hypothetical protein